MAIYQFKKGRHRPNFNWSQFWARITGIVWMGSSPKTWVIPFEFVDSKDPDLKTDGDRHWNKAFGLGFSLLGPRRGFSIRIGWRLLEDARDEYCIYLHMPKSGHLITTELKGKWVYLSGKLIIQQQVGYLAVSVEDDDGQVMGTLGIAHPEKKSLVPPLAYKLWPYYGGKNPTNSDFAMRLEVGKIQRIQPLIKS